MATTETPDTAPLEPSQVWALADGTPIIVIWSGGNGPHRYVMGRLGEMPVARTKWEVENDRYDVDGKCLGRFPYAFVGTEAMHTRVWLASNLPIADARQGGNSPGADERAEGRPT